MTQAKVEAEEGWPWGVSVPPRGEDLPCDDGEPMETELHGKQMDLTLDYARVLLQGRKAYVAGNMAFYYSALQAKRLDFKAPDIMIFLDVEPRVRKSWVMWEEEGKRPDVVIELLSTTTANNDLGRTKEVYHFLGVPEYFVFDPIDCALQGWSIGATHYAPIVADAAGRLPSAKLGVSLGTLEHEYGGARSRWLRFFDGAGNVVPTNAEAEAARADAEAARAESEAARADAAEREVAQLKAKLAALERSAGAE